MYYCFFYLLICLLALFLLYFYRDPVLKGNVKNKFAIVSPAQGKILRIIYDNDTVSIWIFLNLTDLHTQYFPISGQITDVKYIKGKFHPAYLKKAESNERVITTLLNPIFGYIRIALIAGSIARSIITYNKRDAFVNQGDRLGRILIGSSVLVTFNKRKTKVLVKENQYVDVNKTILAIKKL